VRWPKRRRAHARDGMRRPPAAGQGGLRRLPPLLVVALLGVGGWAITADGADERPPTTVAVAPVDVGPVVTDSETAAALWFCAGAMATAGGEAEGLVIVSNAGTERAEGRLAVFASGEGVATEPIEQAIEIEAGSRLTVRLSDVVEAPYAAVQVETRGGAVAVDLEVFGPTGHDVTPCATRASDTWYLPWGQTVRGASMRLALFNPFSGDAVVDVAFETENGYRTPVEYEGRLVPGHRLVVLDDIDALVTIRQRVTAIITVRQGRLVASGLQTVTGANGELAVDATTAAPEPSPAWFFADGRADAAALERYVVHNPSRETAEVELVLLDTGVSGVPASLRLPPGGTDEFIVNLAPGVALPLQHAALVQSRGDVPVVVARVLQTGAFRPSLEAAAAGEASTPTTDAGGGAGSGSGSAEGSSAAQPDAGVPALAGALGDGLSMSLGTPVTATRWVLASAGSPPPSTGVVSVLNTGSLDAQVQVVAVRGSDRATLADQVVAPGRRMQVALPADHWDSVVVVEADQPVVAGRIVSYAAPVGLGSSPGVPLGATASVAEPTTGLEAQQSPLDGG